MIHSEKTDAGGIPDPAQSLEAFRATVQRLVQRQEYPQVLALLDDAHRESLVSGDQMKQATALTLTGYAYRYVDRFDESREILRENCTLWRRIGNKCGLAECLKQYAITLMHGSGDEEAMRCLQQALDLFRQIGDRTGEMAVMSNMGNVYKRWGDLAAAQELWLPGAAYYEEHGPPLNAAKTLLNIGNNYIVLNDPGEAVACIRRGLQIFESLGNRHDSCLALNVLGAAYVKQDTLEQDALEHDALEAARDAFEQALALCDIVNVAYIRAVTLSNLGDVYLKMEDFEKAEPLLEEALRLSENRDPVFAQAEALERLGNLYAHPANPNGSLQTAADFLTGARDLLGRADASDIKVRIFAALANLYERLGDARLALEHHRLMHQTEKQLFNETSDRRMKSLKIRMELEKARKDAETAHRHSVELARALAEMEHLRTLAEAQARTDALTGVYNRRFMDERLAEEWERASRYGRPLSVALLDIDFFKKINDTFGHAAGDAALCRVARLLRDNCRASDQIARYGGEEFALLAPEADADEMQTLCERMRVQIETADWSTVAPGMHLTLSIGFCTLSGEDWLSNVISPKLGTQMSPQRLLAAADANLYAAKQSGRNRVIG